MVLTEVGVLRVIAMAGEVATSPKTLPDSGARRIIRGIETAFHLLLLGFDKRLSPITTSISQYQEGCGFLIGML